MLVGYALFCGPFGRGNMCCDISLGRIVQIGLESLATIIIKSVFSPVVLNAARQEGYRDCFQGKCRASYLLLSNILASDIVYSGGKNLAMP